VLSPDRTPLMPELRTAHEQGLEGVDITTWTAFSCLMARRVKIVDKPSKITREASKRPPSSPVCTTSG
jgi:hypothetical protein